MMKHYEEMIRGAQAMDEDCEEVFINFIGLPKIVKNKEVDKRGPLNH